MNKHSKTPWEITCGTVISNEDCHLAECGRHWEPQHRAESIANASHIVACVNACEGINPEAVPEMLKALLKCKEALTRLREGRRDGATMGESSSALDLVINAIDKAKTTEDQADEMTANLADEENNHDHNIKED